MPLKIGPQIAKSVDTEESVQESEHAGAGAKGLNLIPLNPKGTLSLKKEGSSTKLR